MQFLQKALPPLILPPPLEAVVQFQQLEQTLPPLPPSPSRPLKTLLVGIELVAVKEDCRPRAMPGSPAERLQGPGSATALEAVSRSSGNDLGLHTVGLGPGSSPLP